jgi:hypothetical protein
MHKFRIPCAVTDCLSNLVPSLSNVEGHMALPHVLSFVPGFNQHNAGKHRRLPLPNKTVECCIKGQPQPNVHDVRTLSCDTSEGSTARVCGSWTGETDISGESNAT